MDFRYRKELVIFRNERNDMNMVLNGERIEQVECISYPGADVQKIE